MKQIELVIQNRTGLHARPAKVLVNLAKKFKSDISLQHAGKRANAKSMVSVLTLGAVSGSGITVQANGVDEEKAIAELEADATTARTLKSAFKAAVVIVPKSPWYGAGKKDWGEPSV